jgi:hypothetical protein
LFVAVIVVILLAQLKAQRKFVELIGTVIDVEMVLIVETKLSNIIGHIFVHHRLHTKFKLCRSVLALVLS